MVCDYSLAHWGAFFSAAVLLNLSPGPDMLFILGQTATGGRRAGFAAMYGIWTGAFGHVVAAALGLSAVLATSALAFAAVKWIGAVYLIWLGVQALLSRGHLQAVEVVAPQRSLWTVFRQGMLVAVLNPKVALFFLAFLPQFVEPGAGPVSLQLFVHGTLIIAVAGLIEPLVVLIGDRASDTLSRNELVARWLDRGLGAVLVTLGVKLAASDGV